MSKGKKDSIDTDKIRRREQHLSLVARTEDYTIQRIDYLTIGISGAFVYYLIDLDEMNSVAKWALVMFIITVILNFGSMWSGFFANRNDYLGTLEDIEELELRDTYSKKDQRRYDRRSNRWSLATRILNLLASLLMLAGVVLVLCSRCMI